MGIWASGGWSDGALHTEHLVAGAMVPSSCAVQVTDPQTKHRRRIGRYASEEDAARAYDIAAVQACGPGAKRNFPDVTTGEAPETVGEEQKQRSSSRFSGVSWDKVKSLWKVRLTDPQTKRRQIMGFFASEGDAARAYDCAAVRARGPDTKRNFPGEADAEQPSAKRQR
jgi:hypothetical protein